MPPSLLGTMTSAHFTTAYTLHKGQTKAGFSNPGISGRLIVAAILPVSLLTQVFFGAVGENQ